MKFSSIAIVTLIVSLVGCVSVTPKGQLVKSLRLPSEILENGTADTKMQKKNCKFINTLSTSGLDGLDSEPFASFKNKATEIGGNVILLPYKKVLGIKSQSFSARVYSCPENLNETLEQIFPDSQN